eukprot:gene7267-11203_t
MDHLAALVKDSKYTVFFAGAGVSTSAGVPDWRGPSGWWTGRRVRELQELPHRTCEEEDELRGLIEESRRERKKSDRRLLSVDAAPSYCHRAISALVKGYVVDYVITTNVDGLFRKAGLKAHAELCCLHGDIYVERCTGCGRDFERNYHVRQANRHVHDHHVGTCKVCGSAPPKGYTGRPKSGALTGAHGGGYKKNGLVGTKCVNVGTKDTHVNSGERIDAIEYKEAEEHCKRAELCIVLGSSMALPHVAQFPFLAKEVVIVNLQETPVDDRCDLRIWNLCDTVMTGLMERLSIVPDLNEPWNPTDPLTEDEMRARGIASAYIDAAIQLSVESRMNWWLELEQEREQQRAAPAFMRFSPR